MELIPTAIRPAIGSLIGVSFADLDQVTGSEEIAAGGAGGSTALLSHGLKAGLRLGINTSPEPFSNIFVSLIEDGIAAGVIALTLKEPLIALAIVVVLLAIGSAWSSSCASGSSGRWSGVGSGGLARRPPRCRRSRAEGPRAARSKPPRPPTA